MWRSKWFWIAAVMLLGVYVIFARRAAALQISSATGAGAVTDAAKNNTYTTYNTSLYKPPSWFPSLKFWRANPYVPEKNQTEEYGRNS